MDVENSKSPGTAFSRLKTTATIILQTFLLLLLIIVGLLLISVRILSTIFLILVRLFASVVKGIQKPVEFALQTSRTVFKAITSPVQSTTVLLKLIVMGFVITVGFLVEMIRVGKRTVITSATFLLTSFKVLLGISLVVLTVLGCALSVVAHYVIAVYMLLIRFCWFSMFVAVVHYVSIPEMSVWGHIFMALPSVFQDLIN
uniref:Uncharacterized protein n=1 Tax=Octopus bimaculoides TaxID=37653 RepID=A0A0L8I5T6_OCTBM